MSSVYRMQPYFFSNLWNISCTFFCDICDTDNTSCYGTELIGRSTRQDPWAERVIQADVRTVSMYYCRGPSCRWAVNVESDQQLFCAKWAQFWSIWSTPVNGHSRLNIFKLMNRCNYSVFVHECKYTKRLFIKEFPPLSTRP
jgi:hypothetical protein